MGPGFLWPLWPWPGNGYAQPCTSGEFVGTLHVTGLARLDGMMYALLETDIGPLKRCIPKKDSSLPTIIFQNLGQSFRVRT